MKSGGLSPLIACVWQNLLEMILEGHPEYNMLFSAFLQLLSSSHGMLFNSKIIPCLDYSVLL